MPLWDPEDYQKSSSEQQKWARELISKLNLKGNERILDIGCGDGKITAELAIQVPNGFVIGIDNSEEMILFAQKNFNSKNFPNLAFQYADATNLDFNSEFDVIVSFSCLHWVIDHLTVLKGIKKSLKPCGRLILQFGGKGNAVALLEVIGKVVSSEKWNRYFKDFIFPWRFYGQEEYKHLLEFVGLKAKRVELVSKDMIHKGKDGLKAWIRTTWLPYSERVPSYLRQQFIDEIANRYVESHPADGTEFIHVQMIRLEIDADKM